MSVFEGDIRDSDLLKTAFQGASTVFHTASIIDPLGKVSYRELHSFNVKGTTISGTNALDSYKGPQ